MPLLSRYFRLERRNGAAPAAAAVRTLLGGADGDLRQRDDCVAGRHRIRADRSDGTRGDRGRLATGCADRRAVGAGPAHRPRRRKRGAGTAFRRGRGGQGDGRSDRRRRPDADLCSVPSRCRAHRVGCPGASTRRRSRVDGPGSVLPGRLSRRGPPRTGTRTSRRRPTRSGQHQCAGAGCRHRGAGCRCRRFPNGDLFWQQAGRSGSAAGAH